MNRSRQAQPGEPPEPGSPIDESDLALIESALVTIRRDQGRRRLQRRAERERGERRTVDGGVRRDPALAHAARFRMLDALEAASGPLSVSELGAAIGVDQPRASRLVQAGQEAGFIRRTVDPRDARRSAIELTATGRQLLEAAHATRRGAIAQALGGFSQQESAQFALLLDRFVRAWPRG